MYEFRVIENESYLEDSQRLLYRVYVEEQGWRFSKNNPAGLKDGNREAVQEQQSPQEIRARNAGLLRRQRCVCVRRSTIRVCAELLSEDRCDFRATMNQMRTVLDNLDKLIDKSESPM
ncbi:3460_t:CDS:2, partial [Cetraspora pellucida]